MLIAECHPEREHLAKGLCKLCYNKKYFQENKEKYYEQGKIWRANNKEKLRNKSLRERFGITIQDFRILLDKQYGLCAVCRLEPGTHLDHNHDTGKIRGILCNTCNRGIGLLKDNIFVLKNAIEYLNKNDN